MAFCNRLTLPLQPFLANWGKLPPALHLSLVVWLGVSLGSFYGFLAYVVVPACSALDQRFPYFFAFLPLLPLVMSILKFFWIFLRRDRPDVHP